MNNKDKAELLVKHPLVEPILRGFDAASSLPKDHRLRDDLLDKLRAPLAAAMRIALDEIDPSPPRVPRS